jgi:UDP-glucose 4-epimerase
MSQELPAQATSASEVPQRRWRSRAKRRDKVVITGIAGRLGQALARHMHRDWDVIGIDRRKLETLPPDVEFHQVDIRRRKAEDIFRCHKIDALIHLNIMHDPRQSTAEHHDFNLIGTQKLFDLCNQHNVPKIVLLSSANVYGPDPANNQFLTEEAPLMAGQRLGFMRDLIALDMYASSFFWRYPQIETVILRPVHLVGEVRNAPSNFLRLKTVPTVLGYDPMIQLLHIEDLIEAIKLSLRPGIRGIYNIAGPGQLPLSELLRALGRTRVPVPEPLARGLFGALWRARISSFPIEELEYLKHICMVDDSRARQDLGYLPRMTLGQTIEAIR